MVYYALDGFTRAYPLIIPFYSFLSGILNNNRKDEYKKRHILNPNLLDLRVQKVI